MKIYKICIKNNTNMNMINNRGYHKAQYTANNTNNTQTQSQTTTITVSMPSTS